MQSSPPTVPDPLRSGRDIAAAMRARRAGHTPLVSVHARLREPPQGTPRATVVAGRGVGGAVVRNRAKRRLRHLIREAALPAGLDVVVVARSPEAATATAPALAAGFARACAAALRKAVA